MEHNGVWGKGNGKQRGLVVEEPGVWGLEYSE